MSDNGLDPVSEYPLRPLVTVWWDKIKTALKFKKDHFQAQADECMKFFECTKALHEVMWKQEKGNPEDDEDTVRLPPPQFQMYVGKIAEGVALYGPSLYHRNPTNIVEPTTTDLPMSLLMRTVPPELMQQAQMAAQQQGQQFSPESLFPEDPIEIANEVISELMRRMLEYLQRVNDKKTHSRQAIDEALIKGMGLLWTQTKQRYATAAPEVISEYDTVNNFVFDPDAECLRDARWIARYCCDPVWEVAEEYGIKEDFLEKRYGTHESGDSQSDNSQESNDKRAKGKSNDLIGYWKIWSRMGMGHKLSQVKNLDDLSDLLDSFGDNAYLAVAEKVPFPLNLKPSQLEKILTAPKFDEDEDAQDAEQEAFNACQWPIPFWEADMWPVTALSFQQAPNNPWPQSIFSTALGYLKFLNWCMSFLATHIRTSSRTIISAAKALEDEIVDPILSGKDFTVLRIPADLAKDGDVSKMVHALTLPQVNGDIWKILEAVFELFDKSTGLTPLMYAAQGGMRSAQEAQIKQGALNIRPDDMASKAEDSLSEAARKEAIALRWMYEEEDVAPVVGNRGAAYWRKYVMETDFTRIAREFSYRIEAGSTRKPNSETQIQNITQMAQVWAPIIVPICQATQDFGWINAVFGEWCKASQIEAKKFRLPVPPPPQPNPMIEKVQAELKMKQEESELKKQEMQAKLQFQERKSELDVQAAQAKTQVELQKASMEMEIEKAKAQQELQLGQQKMAGDMQMQHLQLGMKRDELQMGHQMKQQEMAMQGQEHQQEMAMQSQQHAQALQQGAAASQAKIQQGAAAAKAKLLQQKQAGANKPKPKKGR